ADPHGHLARRDLVRDRLDGLRWRTDPGQIRGDDGAGEVRVLGQEAVPGVDGVGTGADRCRDHLVDVQVRAGGRAGQRVRLVGQAGMWRVPVRFGVHRDATDAAVPTGTRDAYRDLAPIGD